MTTSNKMLTRGFAAALALILGAPAAQAAEVWLEAKAYISGAGVLAGTTMLGYADCGGSFAGCAAAPASSPGPTIAVPPGEGLTIHLRNSLTEATSIHLVGQINAPLPAGAPRVNGRLQSLVPELPPGADGDYSWTDAQLRPGTYLYQSGSHVQLQVQMGLYGAMVHDDAPGSAYPSVPYDSSQLYVFSEVDPVLHSPPSPVNATAGGYQPRVLLINGVPLDGPVLPAITAGAGERVLLRLVNAGLSNHAPQLIGERFDVVAEDGFTAPVTRSQTSLLLPAAKTADLLFTPAAAGTYGFFDRMARVGPLPPPESEPPTAPGTPTFSNITFNSATANWTAATDNVGVTGYDYSLDGFIWTSIGNVLTVNLSGLTPSTLYTFRVRARDFSGNIGPASSSSFTTADPPPESEPPTAPGTPTITNVTHNGATATWTAATDNIGVTDYQYSLNGISWTSIGNVLTVNLAGLLTPSTTYTFQVRARDFAGNIGPAASSAPFTTDAPPPDGEAPTAPGTPTFANITMTSATADWAEATDNVGVTGYEYSLDGFTWTPIGVVLSVNLSGLTHSTTYTFRVRATDAAGNIGPASSAAFTTQSPANPVANPDLFYITANNNPGTTTFPAPGVLANDTDGQFDALRVQPGSVTALLGAGPGAVLDVNTQFGANSGRVLFTAGAANWVGDATFSYVAQEAVTPAQLLSSPAGVHIVHDQHVSSRQFINPAGTVDDRWNLAGSVRALPTATTLTITILPVAGKTCFQGLLTTIPLPASAVTRTWSYTDPGSDPQDCKRLRFEIAVPAANGVPAHTSALEMDVQKVIP